MVIPDRSSTARPARRAARRRADVLDGVGRVIARRGIEATRFADVVEETGASLSTLQYSFGNREDLIIAALRRTNRAEIERVGRAVDGATEPVERLRRLVVATVGADGRPEDARVGWLVWIEYWRAAARDPELAIEWRAVYDEWLSLIRAILADGRAVGAFVESADPEILATVVLALFDGLGIPMALSHAGVTPGAAAERVLQTLAGVLGCPDLALPV